MPEQVSLYGQDAGLVHLERRGLNTKVERLSFGHGFETDCCKVLIGFEHASAGGGHATATPLRTFSACLARKNSGEKLLSFQAEKDRLVEAASALGRELIVIVCRRNEELGQAFAAMVERGAGALIHGFMPRVPADAVVSFAAQYKIPAMYYERLSTVRGGLMSYSPDFADRIVAGLVGQILNGAGARRPADQNFQ